MSSIPMSSIPIVLTFDKNVILGAAVTVKSLISCANPQTRYSIFVFHPDIPSVTIDVFYQMLADTQHTITFTQVERKKFANMPINTGGGWSEIVYYRLYIPELLPDYDKVIYSDVDVLINCDLTQVYNTDITDYEWAGVIAEKNSEHAIGHQYFAENTNDYIFWSGFLLMNTHYMREQNFIDRCCNVVDKFADRLKFFDLDTINLASSKIQALPFKYVTLQSIYYANNITHTDEYDFLKEVYTDEELIEAKHNPAIIHYAGSMGKPWHKHQFSPEYLKYVLLLPRQLKIFTHRDRRKKMVAYIKDLFK